VNIFGHEAIPGFVDPGAHAFKQSRARFPKDAVSAREEPVAWWIYHAADPGPGGPEGDHPIARPKALGVIVAGEVSELAIELNVPAVEVNGGCVPHFIRAL
jgi:hypothetical protein